ncbi:MAG TPA: transporter, partial [Flavobacteriaceae bacterium]|nr:transporter [Flavobacteriaceae bacterium]
MINIAIRIAFLLFSGSYFSFSQPIITDRPDQTESAVTLEKGRLQIESG